MKKIWIVAGAGMLAGIIVLAGWLPGCWVVPVLMYHSINMPKVEKDGANTVSPEAFDRQMKFIKKNGYHVVSIDEYVAIKRAGGKFPAKSVVITFDDGLLDNYTNAYPILRKNGFPSLMFIPSADVGLSDASWGQPQMNWAQLLEMKAHGVTIGSHTVTHAYLPALTPEKIRHEIADSKNELEAHLGCRVDYLAYPTGGFSEEIKQLARKAGYHAAFTTNRGYSRLNQDLYELKRIRPKDKDGSLALWVKLSGYYNLVRSSKESQ